MDFDLSWIAQIFGVLAISFSLIIYSRKDRSKILIFKCAQDICWLSHYLILSAFSAAASSGLCIFRSVAFYGNPKKKEKSILLLWLFIILFAISAWLTWKSPFSLLPAISSSISTIAFWMKNPQHTKILAIFASLVTLSYNITVAQSLSVYIGVTITIFTSIISLITSKRSKTP